MTDNFLEKGDRERMVCLWSQGSRQQAGSAQEGGKQLGVRGAEGRVRVFREPRQI